MFKLRDYQGDCVNAVLKALSEVQSAAALMPCGAGKTEVFIELANRLVGEGGGSALVLSHLALLTDQTEERFISRRPELRASIMQGNRLPQQDSRVVISTMQTSRDLGHIEVLRKRLRNKVKYVFVDEMQMLPTPSYETIRHHFPDVKLVGFTATPFRGSKIMTGYVDQVAYSISMQDVIDLGYLVPPKVIGMKEHDDVAETMSDVLGLYQAHEAGNGAICFMRSKADARALKVCFTDRGISCRAVTDDLTGRARHDLLAAFNAGEIDVLTTVNVLTAGFDSPRVRCVFMPYGASTPTTYIQRVGRALRIDPKNGKTEGRIYVAGEAPGISSKTFERLTAKLLLVGGETRDHGTFREDLELNDYGPKSDTLHFTQEVCRAIQRLETLGLKHFADMLDHKDFPPRYMASITSLLNSLPKNGNLAGGTSPATDGQKAYLFAAGFGSSKLGGLTKGEANAMIAGLTNHDAGGARSKPRHVIPEGTHMGKHVSETPATYRKLVLSRYPDGPVAQVIREWEQQEKKHA